MYNQLNRILYLSSVISLLSMSAIVACQTKDNEKTTEAVTTETTSEMSPSEWQAFKGSAEKTIANNEARVATLKDKIRKSNTPNLDKLRQARIDELEDKNTALRAKIMEYKEEDTGIDLAELKAYIQKELDDLEKALKELDEK